MNLILFIAGWLLSVTGVIVIVLVAQRVAIDDYQRDVRADESWRYTLFVNGERKDITVGEVNEIVREYYAVDQSKSGKNVGGYYSEIKE